MSIVTRLARSSLPAAILILAGTSALAAGDSPAAAPAAAQATTVAPATVTPKPEDKVICKTEVGTGSRLGAKKTCMKKSDWAVEAQAARRERDFAPPAGIAGAH
jgi:hypothetical protein